MNLSALEERGARILLAAGVLVGIAIALDGPVAKAFNGAAGIAWFISAWLMVRGALRHDRGRNVVAAAVVVGLVLVIAVKPSDLLWAAIGFTIGGVLVGATAKTEPDLAALVLPALWLPLHLLVAVSRAAERALRDIPTSVRTDPPPTAAIVPLAMIVAAYAGGLIVAGFRERSTRGIEPAHTR